MGKEWILNNSTNRFQYNQKRNVGPTSESIRKCSPKEKNDWKEWYFKNVYPEKHLELLGKKLFEKIKTIVIPEIQAIKEKDCIDYIKNLVIDRTYDGYVREIFVVYGYLEKVLKVKIAPAPDDWDRLYNVDFYININNYYIGLQIKPTTISYGITEINKEEMIQKKSHEKFFKKYGGKVFYIYSAGKDKDGKDIKNKEVIKEIKAEINRLKKK